MHPVMRRRAEILLGEEAWSPSDLGSNLKGWWKADAGVRARTAAQFTAANSETLSRADEAAIKAGDIDFYWCGWFYIDSDIANYRALCVKGVTINGSQNYALYIAADEKPVFIISNKSATWGSGLSTATWYFIEGYHDAANDLVGVCVNRGTDVTAATAGAVPDSTNTAALTFGKDSGGAYYDGRMGNVGFFKRLPSTAERDAIYNSGAGRRYADLVAAGVSLTSLTGWWEMDENSGTRADKSGNALTLTDNNTVTASDGLVDYTASDGDAVWKWQDQSGAAYDLVQATQANKPIYKTNIINGKPVIRFDGAGDHLAKGTTSLVTQANSMWMVVDDNDAAARVYFDGDAASKQLLRHDGTNLEINAGSDVGAAHTAGDPHFIQGDFAGASSEIWVDGVSLATGDAGAQEQDGGFTVGADNAGANSLAGDIAEVIANDAVFTAGERAQLDAYATSRYAL